MKILWAAAIALSLGACGAAERRAVAPSSGALDVSWVPRAMGEGTGGAGQAGGSPAALESNQQHGGALETAQHTHGPSDTASTAPPR